MRDSSPQPAGTIDSPAPTGDGARSVEAPITEMLLLTRSGDLSATELVMLVRASLRKKWQHGQRQPVEAFLVGFPSLKENDAAVLDLIFDEVGLREERGEKPEVEEYVARFPRLADPVRRQFALHEVVRSIAPPPVAAAPPAPVWSLPPRTPFGVGTPTVEGYEIHGELGRGGMGVVYKARHKKLNRLVALKMVLTGAHAGAQDLARFRTEAEAVASLQHPNIVQIYEVGEQDGLPFFSLEYIDGGSLADKVYKHPEGLPPREAAALVEKLAEAMQAAHQHGIIHRDLKPANVLLTKDGVPKITDFGLAKRLGSQDGQTRTGSVMGTPNYMSPEQAAGQTRLIGTPSDVYALGALLYETLTGRPPFDDESPMETLRQVIDKEPVAPSILRPEVQRDLETITLKCLHKEAQKRYGSAQALAEDLRRYLNHLPIEARPIGGVERAFKWARRHPAIAVLTGFLLLAFAALLVGGVQWHLQLEGALAEEARLRREAVQGKEAADDRSVRLMVMNGTRQVESGDVLGALPWFTRALRREEADPGRALLHRVRIGAAMHQSPRIRQMWFHDSRVTHAAYSPDGKKVLTTTGDGTARLWDTRDGSPLGEAMRHGDREAVVGGAFSPNGSRVVTASLDGTARLWDARTGKALVPPLLHAGPVYHAEFNSAGDKVLTASGDGTARLWDAATGQASPHAFKHDGPVRHAAFSPDGKFVATASDDKTARLWDVARGESVGPALKHDGPVLHAAFSPDSKRLATASDDETVRLWDVPTGKHASRPLKHGGPVFFVAFNPADGKHIVTASEDNRAQIWDTSTGDQVGARLRHGSNVTRAAFSADGKTIATASDDDTARVWDAATGEPLSPPLRHNGTVHSAAFSPTDKHLLTASDDGTARVWVGETNELLGPPLKHDAPLTAGSLSPDGRLALTATRGGDIRLWNPADGKPLSPTMKHEGPVTSAVFSPDGLNIVSASADHTAQVWDVTTRQKVGPRLRHDKAVNAATFSPDNRQVATASDDKSARVWDAATGREVARFDGHTAPVHGARFSPDGKRVVTASADHAARVWDIGNPKTSPLKLSHGDDVLYAEFSPDGKRVVTASADRSAQQWDAATGQKVGPPLRHASRVVQATFDPDGKRIATASDDNTARIWGAATGQPTVPPMRHGGSVARAVWGPSGQRLLTASDDNTARAWDAATGEPLSPPLAHNGGVVDVDFNDNGQRVLTASSDKTARLWNLPPDERSMEELEDLAQLLAGGSIDATDGFVPLDAEALKAVWIKSKRK